MMFRHGLMVIAALALVAPSLAAAQMQDRMARPGGPGNGGPGNGIRPPRPGNGRPGNGGPAIQPPRPVRPTPVRPTPVRPVKPVRPPHQGHRPGFHRPPHYRPPVFHYPPGYHYRRWHVGAVLPALLFGSAYWFHDYHQFGLAPPPLHYRWVRYGPDLVLVNTRNGHVRDVRYGVFR